MRFSSTALLLAGALATAGLAASPAAAQVFGALGKPLPTDQLPNGTLSVRVINGDASQPAVGVDVTVTVNGNARAARTDSEGRAMFPGVPGGATVFASVRGPDGEIKSDQFPFPTSGGIRVLLSTKPLAAEVGGAPDGPGGGPGPGGRGMGGGMPEPRQMTGQPRVEPADPGGVITVRVTHNDFSARAPAKHPVHLVAFGADGKVTGKTLPTDPSGRVTFQGLDRSGGTSYFALTLLPRDGVVDRLISSPMVPDASAGIRLILSGAKQGSGLPAIDDLTNFSEQPAIPAGRVQVQLDWVPELDAKVGLVDTLSGELVASGRPKPPLPQAGSLTAELGAIAEDSSLQPGQLALTVTGPGAQRGKQPLAEGAITVRPVGGTAGIDSAVSSGQAAFIGLPPGKPLEAVVKVGDETVTTAPFTLPVGNGGRAALTLDWKSRGVLEVRFDGIAPDRLLHVDVVMRNEIYRSYPFQTVADRGTVAAVAVVPRVLFKFSLASAVEDAYFAVQGRFEVQNWAWAPYRAGDDGLHVPLPDGFTGPVVFDLKDDVAVDDKGFRILKPLPPGGLRFHGGFSLKTEDGAIRWDMPLPRGVFDSGIQIRQTPDMKVELPTGATGKTMRDDDGTPYYVIPNISIRPGQRMVMTISGLPSQPAWRVWAPRVAGIVVLLVLGVGLASALARRAPAAVVSDGARPSRARIDALYDELVALDRDKGDAARRAEILAELERLLEARAAGARPRTPQAPKS